MKFDCTGVILAGGENSRLPGKKKAFQKIGNSMIIEKLHSLFSNLFKEIIIVVNEPGDFAGLDMNIVTDIIPSQCALAGLHAGLFYSSNHFVYATACDTPFVNQKIVEHIADQIEPEYDVIIPRTDDGLETMFAVYSKNCIPLIENNLAKNIFMIKKFFKKKRVKEIPVEQLKKIDPEMQFIFNINTLQDLNKARKIADKKMVSKTFI